MTPSEDSARLQIQPSTRRRLVFSRTRRWMIASHARTEPQRSLWPRGTLSACIVAMVFVGCFAGTLAPTCTARAQGRGSWAEHRSRLELRRERLRLDALDDDMLRPQLSIRRMERSGFLLAGFCGAGVVVAGTVALTQPHDLDHLGVAVVSGLVGVAFLVPLVIGLIVGSIGTVRRRRLQRRGEWLLDLAANGVRFDVGG